jgi:hypothetical protein
VRGGTFFDTSREKEIGKKKRKRGQRVRGGTFFDTSREKERTQDH